MLELVRGLGYTGIELGPPGYLGADARRSARARGVTATFHPHIGTYVERFGRSWTRPTRAS